MKRFHWEQLAASSVPKSGGTDRLTEGIVTTDESAFPAFRICAGSGRVRAWSLGRQRLTDWPRDHANGSDSLGDFRASAPPRIYFAPIVRRGKDGVRENLWSASGPLSQIGRSIGTDSWAPRLLDDGSAPHVPPCPSFPSVQKPCSRLARVGFLLAASAADSDFQALSQWRLTLFPEWVAGPRRFLSLVSPGASWGRL
jgi:hypothetical protein